jgi:hypothetical protein
MEELLTIAKPLPPEEIRAGMYVVVMSVVVEIVPSGIMMDSKLGPPEVQRVVTLACDCADCGHLLPMKVLEVCLPIVLVKRPILTTDFSGGPRTELRALDVRRHRLAQVSDAIGKRVFKRVKAAATRSATPESS